MKLKGYFWALIMMLFALAYQNADAQASFYNNTTGGSGRIYLVNECSISACCPPSSNLCAELVFQFTAVSTGTASISVAPDALVGTEVGYFGSAAGGVCNGNVSEGSASWPLSFGFSVPVVQGKVYCLDMWQTLGSVNGAGPYNDVYVTYNLPLPPGPPEPSNAPLPLWVYAALALALAWIARRQLLINHSGR